MEALRETRKSPRTITLSVPSSDYSFLRSMTTRMGWTIIPQPRKRKTGLQLALEDVKAGRVHKAESIEDLFNQLNAD